MINDHMSKYPNNSPTLLCTVRGTGQQFVFNLYEDGKRKKKRVPLFKIYC